MSFYLWKADKARRRRRPVLLEFPALPWQKAAEREILFYIIILENASFDFGGHRLTPLSIMLSK